jgi:COMPASS component SWD1
MVNIWQTTVDESWSAFAPGFEELEENREYEEREDEFDIVSPWRRASPRLASH